MTTNLIATICPLIPVIRDEAGKRIFVTNSTAVGVRPADQRLDAARGEILHHEC